MAETKQKPAETDDKTVYTRDDLINAASAFGVTSDVMAGALRAVDIGDKGLTRAKAQRAVDDFNEREV